ncbi:hypothetical protein A167_03072 [Alcanivorax sp. S71-1-4]|uniref:DUF2058 domain-containing protein n=1 Tax=Alcanivorax sp. S71-1-4 TaxID=1177159 RepID=UPI0013590613|nr:DUF2058 domain-containing protein [Alcanivorax sp. S71-1-4]KAF0806948.1 hypothetical protein A167_03072 [Alcanivorax sp. S71-1-4]
MASLKDQLLKAGLVDKKRARQADHQKRQENKRREQGESVEDAAARVRQQQAEQAERSRQLNQQREDEARQRALVAQVRQLVSEHRVDRAKGDAPYQFTDQKKIQKIYVLAPMVDQLARGQLAVVRLENGYEVVPAVVAQKIQARLPEAVVVLHSRDTSVAAEDDPYADYPIPDDLMW